MKTRIVLSLVPILFLALAATAHANGVASNGLALGILGKPDEALLTRVQAYLTRQFHTTVRRVGLPADVKAGPEAIRSARTTNDVAMLVLLNAHNPEAGVSGAILPRVGMAMLDLAPLRTNLGDKNPDEVFARRVEKESVRSMALALGLAPCPILRCALYETKALKQLDQKSRSLCPPCDAKASAALRSKGVKLRLDRALAVPPAPGK